MLTFRRKNVYFFSYETAVALSLVVTIFYSYLNDSAGLEVAVFIA